MAQILRQKGFFDIAETIFNQILSQVSSLEEKSSILFDLGKNLELQSFWEEARENYQKAIISAKNPNTLIKAQLGELKLLILQINYKIISFFHPDYTVGLGI